MADNNQLSISGLAGVLAADQNKVAVGMSIAKLQMLTLVAADEDAPHFLPQNRPVLDGQAYQATDGRWYYRPVVRVLHRSVAPNGPEVRFLKDAQGKVRLEFELEEAPPPNLPDGAEPFPVRVTELKLTWTDRGVQNSRIFAEPSLVAAPDTDDETRSNFSVLAGADLTPEEVQPLSEAMRNRDAAATLTVTLSFGYWLDEVVVTPPPPPPGPHRPRPRFPIADRFRLRDALVTRRLSVSEPVRLHTAALRASTVAPLVTEAADPPPATAHLAGLGRLASHRLFADPAILSQIIEAQRQREINPQFHTETPVHTLDFYFDPGLEQHRGIYAAIRAEGGPTEAWESHPFGMIARAPAVNTVFRLPDEVRLAYSPDLKAPYVRPTLYTNDADETMVRVVLRAMPWHDPQMLVALSDELRRSTGGALAAPRVVIGGYQSAMLKLTSAFPEGLRLLGGEETAVTLEGGFDMLLDVSLEFYRFLCELLIGPIGLTGIVSVTLPAPEGADPLTKQIPVRLNLDDFASLPLEVSVPADALLPQTFTLANRSGALVTVGGCVSRLLQIDANSVTPLEVYEAETETQFPAEVPVDGAIAVELKPAQDDGMLWNAVHVEVLNAALVDTPKAILDRVHELPGTGAFAWRIQVECPVFLSTPLPEQFKNLHRVHVEVSREGFAAQEAVLGPGQAQGTISMQRSLREILQDDALGLATFKYRIRNIYLDHMGQWSDEQTGQGSNLFVFPNPVEND